MSKQILIELVGENETGYDYAEYQLGRLYLYGRDVEQDYEKATLWWKIKNGRIKPSVWRLHPL